MSKWNALTEQYLSGSLSPTETKAYEEALKNNPDLNPEFNFQKEVIEGVQSHRLNLLKARLSAINPLAPWYVGITNHLVSIPSLATILGVVMVGVGSYYYVTSEESNSPSKTIEVGAPKNLSVVPFSLELFSTKELLEIEIKNKPSEKQLLNIETTGKEENDTQTLASINAPSSAYSTNENRIIKPISLSNIHIPTIDVVEDESALSDYALVNKESAAASIKNTKKDYLQVVVEHKETSHIKYKLFEGNLFLSGDFQGIIYNIIELNKAQEKVIYLQYLDTYYRLNTTSRLSRPIEVADKRTIQDIELMKSLR